MRLHPTSATFHVALAGAAVVAVGLAAREAPMVAYGGAMILAVAVGRAAALIAVTHLRAAGFEMVWSATKRVVRTTRDEEIVVHAELRNRSPDEMRGVAVRAVVSSMIEARIEPSEVDLPAESRTRVKVILRGRRVGRWGVHGVALEVRGTKGGGDALYEVPLMFANPLGVEVYPRALHAYALSPRGGRARRVAEVGRPAPLAGEGDELRELRDHVPGDPFRRIAWRASARRGKLVVREMEREERDIVWLVLDASVELWAGPEGRAPLDAGVEEMSALATKHLARGDLVGLAIFATRLRTFIEPARGAGQALKIAAALTSSASMIDADRSELDEWEVAQRVAEHARPLDPRGLADIPRSNLDMLAARAEQLRARAPFAPRIPFAAGSREQALRHYLAAFGVEVPPRTEGERDKAHDTLAATLGRILKLKSRASVVHVFAPAPPPTSEALRSIRRLRARRVYVTWSVPPLESSVGQRESAASDPVTVEDAVVGAVLARARAARARAERSLRSVGVTPHVAPRRPVPDAPGGASSAT